jgi:hypothetical protein
LRYLHELHTGFHPGQLPSLAAAHPEAYARFIDCCVRSPQLQASDMAAATEQLSHAVTAMLSSAAALANTAAVASVASALASLVKRAVQFTHAAVLLRGQQLEQDTQHDTAAAHFPAALSYIMDQLLYKLATGLKAVSSSSSSSSNKQQARASAVLLAVVAARSLAQLAAAMEAAGPQLMLASHDAAPAFSFGWASAFDNALIGNLMQVIGEHSCMEVQQIWQMKVFGAVAYLCDALRGLGLLQPQQHAEAAALQAAGVDAAEQAGRASSGMTTSSIGSSASSSGVVYPASCADAGGSSDSRQGNNGGTAACPASSVSADTSSSSSGSSSSSSSSSSTGMQLKWIYLLRLQQSSKKWRAAAAACEISGMDVVAFRAFAATMQGSNSCTARVWERSFKESRIKESLQLVRTLAAVAPLPVVCNNLSCENLDGVSEAAAACKVCAGCRCRYCSVACQRADWKRHKRACRRMAAAGAACLWQRAAPTRPKLTEGHDC